MSVYSKYNQPIGFTFTCPRCGGKRTFYSAGDESWVCMDCELPFDRPNQVNCDFCDTGAICLTMTRMGVEHHLCQKHKLLYGV